MRVLDRQRHWTRRPGTDVERATTLGSAMGSSAQEAADLVRRALALRPTGRRAGGDDLVAVFAELAGAADDPQAARGRLLLLLVDLEQRPLEATAQTLSLPAPEAQRLLTAARRSTSGAPLAARCRGWGLVSRARLTAAEQSAGAAHLDVCRRCRDSLATRALARRELLARSGAVAALVGASLVAAAATGGAAVTAAAGGGLVLGKAAVAFIGALGAALVVGGGAVAVTSSGTEDRAPRSPVVHSTPAGTPDPSATARSAVEPRPAASTCGSPCSRPAPDAARATDDPEAPLPAVDLQLPTLVELPVQLPTVLPSLPAVLPSLPAVLPSLPAVLPSLPAVLPSLPAVLPSLPAVAPSLAPLPPLPAAP